VPTRQMSHCSTSINLNVFKRSTLLSIHELKYVLNSVDCKSLCSVVDRIVDSSVQQVAYTSFVLLQHRNNTDPFITANTG